MTSLPKSTDANPVAESAGPGDRVADVEHKHRIVSEFLQRHRFDALLLQKPSNFAWFTSGADNTRGGGPEPTAALFITPQARVVVTNNVDSVQLFETELPGLGFQLKQRAWHEPHRALVEDLCRGRVVAADGVFPGARDASVHVNAMRLPLSGLEIARLRELGRRLVHCVEATARNSRPDRTEAEYAGELANRLVKRRITPVRLQVAGDGRGERYRHWTFGNEPVREFATLTAVGRWHGLSLGVSRTFCFHEAPAKLRESHNRAVLMLATGAAFSQHDWELHEVWKRVKRIYEKFGVPDEWQLARQAEIIGYELTEIPLVPKSEFQLAAGMPIFWHPSVGPALMGDSYLITDTGVELLTPTEQWPHLDVDVKGQVIHCPDLLVRKATESQPAAKQSHGNTPKELTDEMIFEHLGDESGSEYDLSAILVE